MGNFMLYDHCCFNLKKLILCIFEHIFVFVPLYCFNNKNFTCSIHCNRTKLPHWYPTRKSWYTYFLTLYLHCAWVNLNHNVIKRVRSRLNSHYEDKNIFYERKIFDAHRKVFKYFAWKKEIFFAPVK